jgi:transcriptional regulator with PAS, ATPase and Fis domain
MGDGAQLVLVAAGDGVSVTRVLPRSGRVVLGRDPEADIPIEHPSVSRRHAELELGDGVSVRDLGSKNGVRVGGVRLAGLQVTRLVPGALVQIGSVLFTVQRTSAGFAQDMPAEAKECAEARGHRARAEDAFVLHGASARLVPIIERIARGTISVLLIGETGVGKDVFARLVHARSRRAGRPFVRIHCAAIPETLFESELFGHVRGAFTGAARDKRGLLETADGGTVFLDEVGEIPLALQVKLLQILEDRHVARLGSSGGRPLDVRFVAATNKDPEQEVAHGRLRQDLYFRLGGMVFAIPALRDRRDEIEPLAKAFVTRACREQGLAPATLSPEALEALLAHPFPGNVRELRNMVERAVLLCADGPIRAEHLFVQGRTSEDAVGAPEPAGPAVASRPPEARRIVEALSRCAGNQKQAAKALGISRRTLVNKLEAFGIPRPRKGPGTPSG